MAYERYDDNENDPAAALQRQLEGQMQTQPAGQPTGLGAMQSPEAPGPMAPKVKPVASTPMPGQEGSRNDGFNPPAGDTAMQAPPASGGAFARYGTGDIADAAGLKTGGYGGEGFSYNERAAKGERGADTIKNSFGKIASRYDPTQAGATRSVMADPDFQRLFPEAKIIEHPNGDMIDFGDGKPVDVLRAARAGGAGEAWQWGVDDGGGGATGGPMGGGLNLNQMVLGGGGDPLAAIQAQLGELSGGGQDEQTLIQQLLQQQGL